MKLNRAQRAAVQLLCLLAVISQVIASWPFDTFIQAVVMLNTSLLAIITVTELGQ